MDRSGDCDKQPLCPAPVPLRAATTTWYGSDEVLHIKGPSAPGALRGEGVLEHHLGTTLGLAQQQNRWARNADNAAVPSGVLSFPDNLDQEQATRQYRAPGLLGGFTHPGAAQVAGGGVGGGPSSSATAKVETTVPMALAKPWFHSVYTHTWRVMRRAPHHISTKAADVIRADPLTTASEARPSCWGYPPAGRGAPLVLELEPLRIHGHDQSSPGVCCGIRIPLWAASTPARNDFIRFKTLG